MKYAATALLFWAYVWAGVGVDAHLAAIGKTSPDQTIRVGVVLTWPALVAGFLLNNLDQRVKP